MAKAAKNQERTKSRTSFIVYNDTMKKIKYIGLMNGVEITSLVDEGLQNVIAQYEKKNGEIPMK